MSYDLDALHAKYGLAVASVTFATVSDVNGTTIIPGVSNQRGVIHQVSFISSQWAQLRITAATALGTTIWTGFAGQTPLVESTRTPCDAGASIFAHVASVAAVTGNGIIHVYYTYEKSGGLTPSSL